MLVLVPQGFWVLRWLVAPSLENTVSQDETLLLADAQGPHHSPHPPPPLVLCYFLIFHLSSILSCPGRSRHLPNCFCFLGLLYEIFLWMTHSSYFPNPAHSNLLYPQLSIHPLKPTSAWPPCRPSNWQCVESSRSLLMPGKALVSCLVCCTKVSRWIPQRPPRHLVVKGKRRGTRKDTTSSPTLRCCGSQFCSRCRMFFPVVLPFPGKLMSRLLSWGSSRSSLPGRPDLGVAAVQSGLGKATFPMPGNHKAPGSCTLCGGKGDEVRPVATGKLIWGVPPS